MRRAIWLGIIALTVIASVGCQRRRPEPSSPQDEEPTKSAPTANGNITPQRDGPGHKDAPPTKQPPDVAETIRKGGTYWSSSTKATFFGKEEVEGIRFWIWLPCNEVMLVEKSDPRMIFDWAMRAGQPSLSDAELTGLGYDVRMKAVGKSAFFFGAVKEIQAGDRGKVEWKLGDSIRDYQGEGELLIHLHVKGKPASNFLTVKVKLTD